MRTLVGKAASVLSIILKGLGQIMLQENSVTGLLFLIGIFYGSIAMGLARCWQPYAERSLPTC